MVTLPQFPLHLVLFPTMDLPLHVFEPRYRKLVDQVLGNGNEFGVVLIERGQATGGGDTRSTVGTVARIIDAQKFTDGRWALATVGVERFRVTEWLPDDPFPQAKIQLWPDDPANAVATAEDAPDMASVPHKFNRCLALASEAGVDVGAMPPSVANPTIATMQMAAQLPIGSFDKQVLLAAESTSDRLRKLDELIEDLVQMLHLRLGGSQ